MRSRSRKRRLWKRKFSPWSLSNLALLSHCWSSELALLEPFADRLLAINRLCGSGERALLAAIHAPFLDRARHLYLYLLLLRTEVFSSSLTLLAVPHAHADFKQALEVQPAL